LLAVMSSYSNSSDPTTTIHITSKITSTITQTASPCCFVVQDTVSEKLFAQYDEETSYRVVNFTSVTTFITPYPQSTLTSITTNTYTTVRSPVPFFSFVVKVVFRLRLDSPHCAHLPPSLTKTNKGADLSIEQKF